MKGGKLTIKKLKREKLERGKLKRGKLEIKTQGGMIKNRKFEKR